MRRLGEFVRHSIRRVYWRARRAVANPRLTELLARKPVCLHLGCGAVHLDGWINIDQSMKSAADIVVDFREIGNLIPTLSVHEVLMIHSLSYVRLWEARDLFGTIYRILEPGGRFTTEFPDVEKCAAEIGTPGHSVEQHLEAIRGFYAFDLGQIRRREPYIPYAFGWAAWHLEAELRAVGFRTVQTLAPETHGTMRWRDSRVEATK